MDPQSQSFTPYSSTTNDTWRLQTDVARIQQVQAEHAERLTRLERRQDDDVRMKSVWGSNSPFPSILSGGTPQQAPLQQPSSDAFRNFDDEGTTLISSLHLDAEDEPRRGLVAGSRANSVRFDETANQNHFSHSSRPSMDYMSRTSSGLGGLGGLQMTERSTSHKSDGRASSVHSIRSTASGRANSLNLDSSYGLSDSNRSPFDNPGLAPGLILLGSVPAIIRCWMNTNFKHDALLYAAVCTGSYKSFLALQLIQKLGFEDNITTSSDGTRMVQLPVYFPEAVPHPASSRSSSPVPQLPTITVDFHVTEQKTAEDDKSITIFLGSDVLRAHNADILFSSNHVSIFDDDRNKLSIPLVRPEDESSFKGLFITSATAQTSPEQPYAPVKADTSVNGAGQGSSGASISSAATSTPPSTGNAGKYRVPGVIAVEAATTNLTTSNDQMKSTLLGSEPEARPASRQSASSSWRPSLSQINTTAPRAESQQGQQEPDTDSAAGASASATPGPRSGTSPAIWSNWRRDGVSTPAPVQQTSSGSGLNWANASKQRETSYQRKEAGIKVLKPKTASRSVSATATTSSAAAGSVSSPADGNRSRFFDDGRRKDSQSSPAAGPGVIGSGSPAAGPEKVKTKSNPIGGGSAFTWLSGGPK